MSNKLFFQIVALIMLTGVAVWAIAEALAPAAEEPQLMTDGPLSDGYFPSDLNESAGDREARMERMDEILNETVISH